MELAILIGIWTIAITLISIFFKGASKEPKEKETIEVKYIDFKDRPTLIRQIHKVEEEYGEFLRAVLKADIDNCIEEYFDCVMAMNNTLQLLGIPKEVIIEGQAKHFKKLEERGWKLK